MSAETKCTSIEEVRAEIDRIDLGIVALIAERGCYVKQAAKFKKTTDDVKAPQRVEQVIAKVKALATVLGASTSVTEQVYRAMISGFIEAELAEHAAQQGYAAGNSRLSRHLPDSRQKTYHKDHVTF